MPSESLRTCPGCTGPHLAHALCCLTFLRCFDGPSESQP